MNLSFSGHTKELTFKQLYEEYYAPFCLYAKRFIEDKDTREDIVSDVFASLWDKIDTFDLKSETALGYKDVRKKQLPQFLETSGV